MNLICAFQDELSRKISDPLPYLHTSQSPSPPPAYDANGKQFRSLETSTQLYIKHDFPAALPVAIIHSSVCIFARCCPEFNVLPSGVRTNTRIQRLRDKFLKEKNDILQQACALAPLITE